MLSDHERHELAEIERRLAEDRRLAATLGSGPPAAGRRWLIRALLGFGVFLVVIGLVTGTAGLFLQGLLCLGGGFAWRRWHAVRSRESGRSAATGSRGTRPDGLPPGWFRPV